MADSQTQDKPLRGKSVMPSLTVDNLQQSLAFFGGVYYEPNSFGGPTEAPEYREPPLKISGDADRFNHRAGNDDYIQPGNLFRLLNAEQRGRLMDNIAAAMQGVPTEIIKRQIVHFHMCDPAYGTGVASRTGLTTLKAAE